MTKKKSFLGKLKLGKKKKKVFGIFGQRKKSPQKEDVSVLSPASVTAVMPPPPPPPLPVTSPLPQAVPALPPPETVTAEQRRAVEAIHGREIAAVLSDQQVLAILKSKQFAPAPPTSTYNVSSLNQEQELPHPSSPSKLPHVLSNEQNKANDRILVASNTYDDGFEVKF